MSIEKDNNYYLIGLAHIELLIPYLSKLIEHFITADKIWNANKEELQQILPKGVLFNFLHQKNIIDIKKCIKDMEMNRIKPIFHNQDNYPILLKHIHEPPYILFSRGEIKNREQFPLAIVGTRKISPYGQKTAEYFSKTLSNAGITIISGLAYGIDSIAHKECVELNNRTIAILGSGIDNKSIYPSSHKSLAENIIKNNGAIISQFSSTSFPNAQNFLNRNRIIAGMSLGTLVIEAPERSGALSTARHALEEGRDVFAIPGNIFNNNSKGTNLLIKKGATPVTDPNDILNYYDIKNK